MFTRSNIKHRYPTKFTKRQSSSFCPSCFMKMFYLELPTLSLTVSTRSITHPNFLAGMASWARSRWFWEDGFFSFLACRYDETLWIFDLAVDSGRSQTHLEDHPNFLDDGEFWVTRQRFWTRPPPLPPWNVGHAKSRQYRLHFCTG